MQSDIEAEQRSKHLSRAMSPFGLGLAPRTLGRTVTLNVALKTSPQDLPLWLRPRAGHGHTFGAYGMGAAGQFCQEQPSHERTGGGGGPLPLPICQVER